MPLAPGQTNIVQNPEFDRRVLANGAVDKDGHFIAPAKSTLYRGRIEAADRAGDGNIYRLQFLYNPTDYTHSGSVDANSSLQASRQNPDYLGSAALFMDIQQEISFDLLFDRTYEAWSPDRKVSTADRWAGVSADMGKWGVLVDIQAMYMLFGMYDSIPRAAAPTVSSRAADAPTTGAGSAAAADRATNDNIAAATVAQANGPSVLDFVLDGSIDPNAYQQMTPTSIMSYRAVWVIFGPNVRYFGVIKSFSIQYTHFTQNMVPVRAAVSFSMMLIPKPDWAVDNKRTQTRRQLPHQAKRQAGRPGFDKYGNSIV